MSGVENFLDSERLYVTLGSRPMGPQKAGLVFGLLRFVSSPI
jgi:hypothetical protein